jgi:hypothetical protein
MNRPLVRHPRELRVQKLAVEAEIVCDQHSAIDEPCDIAGNLLEGGRGLNV